MELNKLVLDVLLVTLSICLTTFYHVYLWHHKSTSSKGTKLSSAGRSAWLQKISKEKEKGGNMLGAQSLRNSIMSSTLCTMVAIVMNIALAALSNNTYNAAAGGLQHQPVFGVHSGGIVLLKYATASLLLLTSFMFNSMALGCVNDANFLLNSLEDFHGHGYVMLDKGSLMAAVGNRVFYVAFPFLMWLFGPVALASSTVAMVWIFYNLDFVDQVRMRTIEHT